MTISSSSRLDLLVVDPAEGAPVPALAMWHKVNAAQLGGRLLVMEGDIAPGVLIIPHTHTREDECAYVLAGELTYQIGDEVRAVEAGTYVIKPRGIPHAFWNAGSVTARVMEMHVPATFDRFYDELAAIVTAQEWGSPAWKKAFDDLNERHGIIQHWDQVRGITERYGVGIPRS